MRYVKIVILSLICLLASLCFVFADEVVTNSAIEYDGKTDFEDIVNNVPSGGTLVVVDNSDLIYALDNLKDISSDSSDLVSVLEPMQLRSVNVSNETITASDANGFKAVVLGLLGDYTSVITDYTYSNTQGYTQHSIDVTPDWTWIGSGVIFIVVLFCCFKMVGGILCNR